MSQTNHTDGTLPENGEIFVFGSLIPNLYDSAYPGSMSPREDGSYVEREDNTSLALALLQNILVMQRKLEDAEAATAEKDAEIERLKASSPNNAKRASECKTLEDWKFLASHLESQLLSNSFQYNSMADKRSAEIAALQARIDSLVLEHCPDEMTAEQKDEWAKHQVVISDEELDRLIANQNAEDDAFCVAHCSEMGHSILCPRAH